MVDTLKVAFTQGRLTNDELDLRVGQAFTARTYANLAAVTAGIPGRPAEARPLRDPAATPSRPTAGGRKPPGRRDRPRVRMRRPETWQDPPPLNRKALKWGLAGGTIALPAMIAVALLTDNKDLFSATVISLIAYCLAWLVLVADRLAARLENHPGEEPRGATTAAARAGQPAS